MKTTRILSMAVLVLAGAILTGCSNKNNEEPERDNIVTLTTTVSFASDEGASAPERAMGEGVEPMMRAMTNGGKKTFAVGDRIDVVYINNLSVPTLTTSNPLTSKDISADGKSANFTVSFTNPNKEEKTTVKCFYPTGKVNVEGEIDSKYPWLDEQDGTLASLSSNEDFCSDESGEWYGETLPHFDLWNRLTIGKFTIKNGDTDVTNAITGMTVNDGTYTYFISLAAATDSIWVAMHPISSEKSITITATDGTNYYEKTVSGKTLDEGNIYPIKVTMTNPVFIDLSKINVNFTAQDGKTLAGTLAKNVKISIAENATVTLDGVTINSLGTWKTGNYAGINCVGNATIIIKAGTTNRVCGFYSDYPGIHVPSGSTLTIQGTGTLDDASSNGEGAGIGGGNGIACGNIIIEGGTISATGQGGAAGIGGGRNSSCGNITILSTVTNVTVSKGVYAENYIGAGNGGTCGTVTIADPTKVHEE